MTGKDPVEKINAKLKKKHSFRLGEGQQGARENPGTHPGSRDIGREEEQEERTP